jgi:glucose/mannose-6-phosphate isomerase
MFDESAIETEESVAARDPSRLVYELATAGAQVRAEVAKATEAAALADVEPPRAVLVATDRVSEALSGILGHLGADAAAVLPCDTPVLPRWVGAADALLVASSDGRHPRLAALVDQASRRGMIVVVAAPGQSPVAAAGRAIFHDVAVTHDRAARWTLMAPLIQAAVDLGVVDAAAAPWDAVADALDEVATACRPGGDPFTNAAKQLAADFAETSPVIAGAGPLAALAARTMASSLALLGCTAAAWFALPEEMAAAGAVLATGEEGAQDFFRDRTEDVERRPRLVVIGEDSRAAQVPSEADGPLGDLAAMRAARALREVAAQAGVRSSFVDVPMGTALARFAAATAFGDFTAAYLGIGLGHDPGAPRPGELPH